MFKLMAIWKDGKPVQIASFRTLKTALKQAIKLDYRYRAWYVIG